MLGTEIENLRRELEKSENTVNSLCAAISDIKNRLSIASNTASVLSRQKEIASKAIEDEITKRDNLKDELEKLDPSYIEAIYS